MKQIMKESENDDKFFERYATKLAKLDTNVTAITSSFSYNVTNIDSLHPLFIKGCRESILPVTAVTSYNDNIQNQDLKKEIFEERAAIIEFDAGIKKDWAEAIAKMYLKIKPISISEEKWDEIKTVLEMLIPCLKDIMINNWSIKDIFGCHPIAPQKRYDFMGLLMILSISDTIVEIKEDAIKILNAKGGISYWYRPHYKKLEGQTYFYDLT